MVGLVLILVTIAFSYKGFKSETFFAANQFEVDPILIGKDYKRLVSAGFLHLSWTHLIVNMYSLLAYSPIIEGAVGGLGLLVIYAVCLVGGNLLALYVHRFHGDYRAVGASGAVCGIIFAAIALYPGMGVRFPFIPLSLPGWLFGMLYLLYSMYGIKAQRDNIGHEAHLGGALTGMLLMIAFRPAALIQNYIPILAISVPTFILIGLVIRNPHVLLIEGSLFGKPRPNETIDQVYNGRKAKKQQELDRLLDKINKQGIDSLSKKEKQLLEELSGV
jgi:membrane associated rhomboid family serine protease